MIDPNDTPTLLLPKLNDMVLAMVRAEPSLSEEHALFYILHHPHGRKLAEHLNNLSKGETMPQVDIMKAISVMEDVLRRRSGSAMAKAMPSLSAENSRTTSISGNSGATLQKPSTLWRWARAWQL